MTEYNICVEVDIGLYATIAADTEEEAVAEALRNWQYYDHDLSSGVVTEVLIERDGVYS